MSADLMTFPNTVEEFMEKYKMVDTDHIYSNGMEYVPIYRMRQWFEHQADTVKHGRWETEIITDALGCKHAYYACSLCGKASDDEYTYCPNCGARCEEV